MLKRYRPQRKCFVNCGTIKIQITIIPDPLITYKKKLLKEKIIFLNIQLLRNWRKKDLQENKVHIKKERPLNYSKNYLLIVHSQP